MKIILVNGLYVYIEVFWSLFNFQNKFIKQFAISEDLFLNFGTKIFWEEKCDLCKF